MHLCDCRQSSSIPEQTCVVRPAPVPLPRLLADMAARNLKQSRPNLEPLASDEIEKVVARAVANNQVEAIEREIENQMSRDFVMVGSGHRGYAGGPPPPTAAGLPKSTPTGAPAPSTTSVHAAVPHGPAGPPPPTPVWEGREFRIPSVVQTPMPTGIRTIQEWALTLLILPKFKDRKWSYGQLIQIAWDDADVLSYVRWIKNSYADSIPKPGKASDLAGFLKAVHYPAEERHEYLTNRRQFASGS